MDEIELGTADPAYLPDLGTQVFGIVHWFLVGFQLLAAGLSGLLYVAYGQYPAVFWGTVDLVLTWWPLLVGGVVVGAIFGGIGWTRYRVDSVEAEVELALRRQRQDKYLAAGLAFGSVVVIRETITATFLTGAVFYLALLVLSFCWVYQDRLTGTNDYR